MPCGTDQIYYAFYPRYFFNARDATENAITPMKTVSARAMINPNSFILPPIIGLDVLLVATCLH
jgi:hypothetical protein